MHTSPSSDGLALTIHVMFVFAISEDKDTPFGASEPNEVNRVPSTFEGTAAAHNEETEESTGKVGCIRRILFFWSRRKHHE